MVQWISTKLGTQVILTKICHPVDFQGQRSRSQLNFEFFRGLTARGYATLCVALVMTVKCRSAIKAMFLYFDLRLSEMLDSLSC
jgi:hypothetical protein